ncbi:type II toxin-antitoxin system ParD family antitoxin [Actinobacillus genomosp. 2]|uniref:type II toxin-antitoxin system ParD family antitoxin n=1 Tax=Actinobacillus genomosp. 2 TaxID=230709 RepID=UPI00244253DE|nr:type II toxin-antitoxin system ParD family antitoxin [Actinobacillus genomosp. 2]WGE31539.1 type II toxin-antitoxin system ParD family antitoxin [Actinobacillus genomosp. 2]
MARTTSVTLGEPLNDFVNQMVESGRYGSTSEVVRTALRLLEEKEQYLVQLRHSIQEGIDSGECNDSFDEIVTEARGSANV